MAVKGSSWNVVTLGRKPPAGEDKVGRARRPSPTSLVNSAGRGLPGVAMREAWAAQPYRLDR
jgi:hypothetical protein